MEKINDMKEIRNSANVNHPSKNTDDEKLLKEIADCINHKNASFIRCIISNPRPVKKTGAADNLTNAPVQSEGISKIKIRPVMMNGELYYQATEQVGPKVFHSNHNEKEISRYILRMILNSFKQCEILNSDYTLHILVSKKGKVTITRKASAARQIVPAALENNLEHNRSKNYIIKEGVAVPFMVELGVMTKDGKIIDKRYDKFRQINRFLEFIRDIKDELPKDREVSIIDFGCGKSYLTFAIYYYLHELCGMDVRITGLDLKADVIEKCNRLSNQFGYDKLVFKMGDIADYEIDDEKEDESARSSAYPLKDKTNSRLNKVDMVVTLHACDTATDYAINNAVRWGAKVILSVPCCQHELNRQIDNELLAPVLSYGILKDRFAAIMTDAIRAEELKINGYETEILEFIDMEHTPKNLLIRAVKKNHYAKVKDKREAVRHIMKEFNVQPSIVKLLDDGAAE